ncbi:hypothetical protein CLM82_32905, partial [Streptomyces albidoflavus]
RLRGGAGGHPLDLPAVLDTMQVLPAFAYLLPVVLVFGIGVPAAVLVALLAARPLSSRTRAASPAASSASARAVRGSRGR